MFQYYSPEFSKAQFFRILCDEFSKQQLLPLMVGPAKEHGCLTGSTKLSKLVLFCHKK